MPRHTVLQPHIPCVRFGARIRVSNIHLTIFEGLDARRQRRKRLARLRDEIVERLFVRIQSRLGRRHASLEARQAVIHVAVDGRLLLAESLAPILEGLTPLSQKLETLFRGDGLPIQRWDDGLRQEVIKNTQPIHV